MALTSELQRGLLTADIHLPASCQQVPPCPRPALGLSALPLWGASKSLATGAGARMGGHLTAPRPPSAHPWPPPIFSQTAQLSSCPVAEQCHCLVHCWVLMCSLCFSWIFNWQHRQRLGTLQSFRLFSFPLQCFAFPVLQIWLTCLSVAIYILVLERMDLIKKTVYLWMQNENMSLHFCICLGVLQWLPWWHFWNLFGGQCG